jgi:hypothetical protein
VNTTSAVCCAPQDNWTNVQVLVPKTATASFSFPVFLFIYSSKKFRISPKFQAYFSKDFILVHWTISTRAQWPRGLRHKPSSPVRTLRSWLKSHSNHGCLSVCLFRVCVVLCVGSGLATGWSPAQGVLPTLYILRNCKGGQGPQKLYSNREIRVDSPLIY